MLPMLRAVTPPERFVDARGRPYFLWDVELTLADYRAKLASENPDEASYWLARALRDAKPDDVLELVDWPRIAELWPRAARFVGRRREFWIWWLRRVGHEVDAQ
jgi:hypothetical protein